ncbi:MAG: hypothetical protein RIF32_12680 [Leptospirales bacterium]
MSYQINSSESVPGFRSKFGFALALGTLLIGGLLACAGPKPELVVFQNENLFPEGVVYDARRSRFLVSSLKKGVIGTVNDDGAYASFIQDERIVSAIGLHIDEQRDRLIVCVSDPGVSVRTAAATQKKLAGLGVYSLADGQNLFFQNLAANDPRPGAAHFANDATVDGEGNIYVTNSFSPVIYKVTPDYQVSEFVRDQRFAGDGFRLNGVDLFGDALIVANSSAGTLTRIPLADPGAMTEVKLEEPLFAADGVTRINDRQLVVITNSPVGEAKPTVFFLESDDNWASAKVTKRVTKDWQFPTTADVRDGEVYVLQAKLNILFSGSGEIVSEFDIHNVSR